PPTVETPVGRLRGGENDPAAQPARCWSPMTAAPETPHGASLQWGGTFQTPSQRFVERSRLSLVRVPSPPPRHKPESWPRSSWSEAHARRSPRAGRSAEPTAHRRLAATPDENGPKGGRCSHPPPPARFQGRRVHRRRGRNRRG